MVETIPIQTFSHILVGKNVPFFKYLIPEKGGGSTTVAAFFECYFP